MRFYTIGTSNRQIEQLIEILKEYQIELVVDVRRFPTSKIFPHFKKENLERSLNKNKIEYCHIEKLGGFREKGYENYLKSKEFREGLRELLEKSKEKIIAIICAEKFPWKCHRVFIAKELEKKGKKVIHIIEKGRIWEPKKEPKEIKPTCQKRFKNKKQ